MESNLTNHSSFQENDLQEWMVALNGPSFPIDRNDCKPFPPIPAGELEYYQQFSSPLNQPNAHANS